MVLTSPPLSIGPTRFIAILLPSLFPYANASHTYFPLIVNEIVRVGASLFDQHHPFRLNFACIAEGVEIQTATQG